jgi:alpha,alpha-trehalase
LRRYGRTAEADRISREFLSLVLEQYRQHGIIVEKSMRSTAAWMSAQESGSNEAGFGWTNAVFTALFDESPQDERQPFIGK